MKKLMTAVSLAVIASGFAAAASAEVWAPTGPFTLENDGDMAISKGLDLSCQLTGSGTLDGDSASVTSFSSFPSLCELVEFADFPYNIEAISETEISLQNVTVTGITGNCFGDLNGTFDQATGKITFDEATLPPTADDPNQTPCVVSGVVNMFRPVSYTFEEPTTP